MQFNQRKLLIIPVIAGLVLFLAALAGCGGEDEDSGGPLGARGAETQESGSEERPDRPAQPSEEDDGGGGQGSAGSDEGESGGQPDRSAEPDGGDGADRQTGGEVASPSKARFLKQATVICARSKAKTAAALNAYLRQGDGPPAERAEKALEEVHVPAMEVRLEALRTLNAPPGDAAEVDAILDAMEAWVALAGQKGTAAKAAIDRGLNRATALARRYGLEQCASD